MAKAGGGGGLGGESAPVITPMKLVGSPTSDYSLKPFTIAEVDFDIVTNETDVIDSGGDTTTGLIRNDARYTEVTNATTSKEYFPQAFNYEALAVEGQLDVVSTDTDVVTVSNGTVSRAGDGTADVVVKTAYLSKPFVASGNTSMLLGIETLEAWLPNTFAKKIFDATASYASGEDDASNQPLFASINHTTGAYVRRTTCWGAGIDTTGSPVYNSRSGNSIRCGALVTKRHITFAEHAELRVGDTVRFVTNGNTTITRTITETVQVGSTDIGVGRLSSDAPSTIKPYKLLSAPLASVLFNPNLKFPVVVIDQLARLFIAGSREYATVDGMPGLAYSRNAAGSTFSTLERQDLPTTNPNNAFVIGDSGGSCLLVYGTDPEDRVLIGHVNGIMNDYAAAADDIQEIIDQWDNQGNPDPYLLKFYTPPTLSAASLNTRLSLRIG